MGRECADGRIYAAIDIGTVSTRLIVARVDEEGRVEPLERQARITDLGEGTDATGALAPAAIERTCAVVADYLERLRLLGAERGWPPCSVATTTTSAARDAANAADLLDPLRRLGLDPQVIAGGIEARLALLGVTADFAGRAVTVADIGGGSTELTVGRRAAGRDGVLEVGESVSYNVGCRRVTERFFAEAGEGAADPGAVERARAFVAAELAPFFEEGRGHGAAGTRLVCVGGTATSLVAVSHGLVPYDSAFVHLHETSRAEVGRLAGELLAMPLAERRALAGLQPKRAGVIAAGALILDVLMGLGGWDAYAASESDSLFGLVACMDAAQRGEGSPIGWFPRTVKMTV